MSISKEPDEAEVKEKRREAMRILAGAAPADIAAGMSRCGEMPDYTELRPTETGLVMLRGRIGGVGAPFNFGEATVTRAAVRLATGERGFSYVLGRDHKKALLTAICDALTQSGRASATLEKQVLEPLRQARHDRRTHARSQTAATKVDFFTLVRGEDE